MRGAVFTVAALVVVCVPVKMVGTTQIEFDADTVGNRLILIDSSTGLERRVNY